MADMSVSHERFPRGNLLPDRFQPVQRLVQRLILLCEMQADQMVYRLPEEARPGHRAHSDVAGENIAEFKIGIKPEFRDIKQHIIRALRNRVLDFNVIKPLQEQIPLRRVFFPEPRVVVVSETQSGDRRLLHGSRQSGNRVPFSRRR